MLLLPEDVHISSPTKPYAPCRHSLKMKTCCLPGGDDGGGGGSDDVGDDGSMA